MSGGEIFFGLIGLCLAFGLTLAILEWVLETLGKMARKLAPYAIMALGAFIIVSIFQADAANAATLSVPLGVVVAATRASLIGF